MAFQIQAAVNKSSSVLGVSYSYCSSRMHTFAACSFCHFFNSIFSHTCLSYILGRKRIFDTGDVEEHMDNQNQKDSNNDITMCYLSMVLWFRQL